MSRPSKQQAEKMLKAQGRPREVKAGRFLKLMQKGEWEYVERNHCSGIVIVLPVTADGKVVFLEQYRVPVGKYVIEFPAGLVNDRIGQGRESTARAAKRGLLEETGYRAGTITRVADGPAAAGSSSNRIVFYLAQDLQKVAPGGGDQTELFSIHEIAVEQADGWLRRKRQQGCWVDLKIYAGLYFLKFYNTSFSKNLSNRLR